MQFTKLTKEERETTIIYNEADGYFTIVTDIQKHIRKFDKLGYECTKTLLYPDGSVETKEYKVPEWAISFRKPVKMKRELTDEQKKAASERIKAMMKAKTQNKP